MEIRANNFHLKSFNTDMYNLIHNIYIIYFVYINNKPIYIENAINQVSLSLSSKIAQ